MRVIIYYKSSRIREFTRSQIYSYGLVFILILVGLVATIVSLILQNNASPLSIENKRLKSNIKELKLKIEEIQNSLSKIYESEKKLQIATGVTLDQEYATGGEELNFSSILHSSEDDLKSLNRLTDELINKVRFQHKKFETLVKKLDEKAELAKHIPAIVPMDGVFSYHGFGIRVHPILRRWKMHEGIDINGLYGTPVYSTGAGTVKFVGWNGGLGLCVIIDHGFGYETTYGHLSKAVVKLGQKVQRFQKIGECGSTGLSTGPHLHYEVSFNGEKQNPVYYFLK